ncbi:MAG: DNA replication and repair protein RecF [Chitinophagaceae bacterium]|nr:DNA replication and repair protein RecF [Chitinophagaceae bacterium]
MLRLNEISLVQFRNYGHAAFRFNKAITGISGLNGSGKTNLMDAVYYLCFTKSYFGKTDAQNAQNGKAGFRLEGHFFSDGRELNVTAVMRENGKKEFSADGICYTKMAAHIGKFPCVMIAPDDISIIMDGSEERRRFIDYTISQLDADYLQVLIDYNKILQQRNSLLKQAAENGALDEGLMDILSDQLTVRGNIIYTKRRQFADEFIPVAIDLYNKISGSKEKITINYISNLQSAPFKEILIQNRSKDLALQRTTKGVHRDDLELMLDGDIFKGMASQGQRKSLLFALKLAEFEILLKHKGFPPLLLLDDVFEKLDEHRMHNLLTMVCVQNQGQVFITDTHAERLENALQVLGVDYEVIKL